MVGARSVKDVVDPIEPPYPGYQRTVMALQKYMQMAKEEVPDPLPQVKKPIAPGQEYQGDRKTDPQTAVSGRPAGFAAGAGEFAVVFRRCGGGRETVPDATWVGSGGQLGTTNHHGAEPADE